MASSPDAESWGYSKKMLRYILPTVQDREDVLQEAALKSIKDPEKVAKGLMPLVVRTLAIKSLSHKGNIGGPIDVEGG